jgi:hypothetical protein
MHITRLLVFIISGINQIKANTKAQFNNKKGTKCGSIKGILFEKTYLKN